LEPTVKTDAERLHKTDARLSHAHMRLDLRRDTRIMAVPNVQGHVHITLGQNEATLILHPHAARRLAANITALLEGADLAHD